MFLKMQPPVIAHRGASYYAPENTLAAFREAKKLGAKWVEFDVMLTADGEAVVIHDETLQRTAQTAGYVLDYPYSFIKTLDAGSWFSPTFSQEKIPTLRQVIELLNELQLSANIEIKAQDGHEVVTVKAVLDSVQRYWHVKDAVPLISSFSLPILEQVRLQSNESCIGYLMNEWQSNWEKNCNQLRAVTVNVNEKNLTPERAALVKSTQRSLLAYTVNNAVRAQELFVWGVDAVFTDDLLLFSAAV